MKPITEIEGILYGLIDSADIEEMAVMLAEVFSKFDPPAVAIGLSNTGIQKLVKLYSQSATNDELTIVARSKETGKLIGAMLTDDFASTVPEGIDETDQNFEKIIALLDGIDKQYRESHPVSKGQIIHLFMLGVYPGFGGKGIAATLVQLALKNGKRKGFETAVTEATGKISQHIFRKLGFIELFKTAYKDFTFKDKKVFESILDHEAVILMERSLSNIEQKYQIN